MMTRRLALVLSLVLLGGCTTDSFYNTAITNLTPGSLARNAEGLYLLEAHWRSNQQSIRQDSFKPQVKVGTEYFPMRRTPLLPDRWEALVPVAADQRYLHYQFKFDYLVNGIPVARPDSKLSGTYRLEVSDR